MINKFLLALSFLFFFFSMDAKPVSENEANRLAENFYRINNNSNTDIIVLETADIVYTRIFNEASGHMQDLPLYYVFNVNTNDGFVMITADDAAVPVLGYALRGHYDPNIKADNFRKWVENYKEQMRFIIENNVQATAEISLRWENLRKGIADNDRNNSSVNPLLGSITWGQQAGFNAQCPGGSVVGCVATAMAQIMKYWSHPAQGTGFYSYNHSTYGTQSVNYGSTTYNFSSMPNTTSSTESAKLSYHCGVAVDMMYSPSGSGAYSSDAKDAFKDYFDYKSSTIEYLSRSSYSDFNWKQLLKTDLNNNQPLYYAGTGSGGGHAFVCDGYDASDNFHYNWGWSGSYDGYFHIDALNPSGVGTGGGTGGFNSNHRIIRGIEPNSGGGGGGGGGTAAADLNLYSNMTLSPTSPVNYGTNFTVSVDIANTSGVDFSGDVAAALLDNNNNFVSFIETKSGEAYTTGFYYSRTFSSTNMSNNPSPGTYSIVLYQKESGAANWSVIADGSYSNSKTLVIQTINSGGIDLYASITPSSDPIIIGSSFSVTANFYNTSASGFSGDFSIDVHDAQGNWITAVEVRPMSLGAGNVYSSNIVFSSTGLSSLTAGTYQLAAWMKPTGGSWELVGNGSYSNPVQVTFAEPSLTGDIYENNNTASVAYNLSASYSGTSATIATPGSNIHVGGDYDYYRLYLPWGYSYFINAEVYDSYNTSSGQYDNDVLFSYDTGNGFSETFDNSSHTIIQPNGGTVIFKVASYYVGQTGSYELSITSNRGTVSLERISEEEALSVFPVPAKDIINLKFDQVPENLQSIEVFNASGQSVHSVTGGDVKQQLQQISTDKWADGTYWLMLRSDDAISRKPLIIAH